MKTVFSFQIAAILFLTFFSPASGAAGTGGKREETILKARELAAARDFDGAIALYEEILGKNRADDEVRNALGFALAWAGRYDAAESEFRTVLERHPDDRDALFGIASLHFWKGDPARSREALADLLEIRPGDEEGLALEKKLRRAELSRVYFRLRTAYRLEDFNFAPVGHGTNAILSYVRKKEWSVWGGGQYWNKFGLSDPGFRIGGSVQVVPSTVLLMEAEIAPKQVVIPRQAYTVEIDQTIVKTFVPFFLYRFADYSSSDLHAFKPGFTWYFHPRLRWRAQYGLSLSSLGAGVRSRHSLFTMLTWNVLDPFDLFAGYARGGENFESGNPVDPVGSFWSHTAIGGLTWEIAGRLGIDFTFSYENRDNGMTVRSFETGLSYRW